MASIGTGYDFSATTYSPDGRVFQVEYAYKAVDNSGTAIALRCKDGVVFGTEKLILSKMLTPGSDRHIMSVGRHVGMTAAGILADARQVANRARSEAQNYKSSYGELIPAKILCDRLSGFVHAYTLYGSVRPFGCATIIGTYNPSKGEKGAELYMIEPSGNSYGYYGCAVGKGATPAKTSIEKFKPLQLTCRQAVVEIAKIIYDVHDDVKDKEFELEMSWVCAETQGFHKFIPADLLADAERQAKAAQGGGGGDEKEDPDDPPTA